MSYASAAMLEWRDYMEEQTGLPPNALGIVGALATHDGGYHCGWDRRRIRNGVLSDYSWQESSRDWSHKSNAARARDIGDFPRLREMSLWLVAQCEANRINPAVNPDCADIRSIIYSPDGITVLRWDRLRLHSGGDPTHRTHTHVSDFANAEHNDKVAVFRRFFEPIPVKENTDMPKIIHQAGRDDLGWWLADGFTRRGIQTPAELDDLIAQYGGINEVGALDHFGSPAGSGTVELDPEDVAAIVAGLRGIVPTAEQIADAVLDEDHKRSAA